MYIFETWRVQKGRLVFSIMHIHRDYITDLFGVNARLRFYACGVYTSFVCTILYYALKINVFPFWQHFVGICQIPTNVLNITTKFTPGGRWKVLKIRCNLTYSNKMFDKNNRHLLSVYYYTCVSHTGYVYWISKVLTRV